MRLEKKRAQMFLMAVLIISLWAILMISAINELGEAPKIERIDEDMQYVLSEIGRESNRRLEYYLSKYSLGEIMIGEINPDFNNFSQTLETYAQANYGANVQITTLTGLTISEDQSLVAGIVDGSRLFLNISGSLSVWLYGTSSEIQTDITIGVSITVDISIQDSRTTLQIIRSNYSYNQPIINANISYTGQTAGQQFTSCLNGTFYYPADLSLVDLNVTTANRIYLSSI